MLTLFLLLSMDAEIEHVIQMHEASRDMIKSLECNYSIIKDGQTQSGYYRRVNDDILITMNAFGKTLITQLGSGIRLDYSPSNEQGPSIKRQMHDPKMPIPNDVWILGLLDVYTGNGKKMSIPELCRKANHIKLTRRDHFCVLSMNHEEVAFTITFSSQYNFMCTRIERIEKKHSASAKNVHYVLTADDFIDYGSIYFPRKSQAEITVDGVKSPTILHHFSEISINNPIDPERFKLSYPEGTIMADFVDGVAYDIAPDGSKIRVNEKYTVGKPVSRETPPGPISPYATIKKEPVSYFYYALAFFGALTVLGLAFEIYRRSKRARKA